MTYCLAISTAHGLVFASDSRTNAGLDDISVHGKMHSFIWEGDRFLTLLSAGSLATTQAVIKRLREDAAGTGHSLLSMPSMAAVADYVGGLSTEIQRHHGERDTACTNFESTFILGGQIGTAAPALYLIYPQGNYIHSSSAQPFFQIGEFKYGKPILDRVIGENTTLENAARCALVSIDSTMRSNLTVGPPIELYLYPRNTLTKGRYLQLDQDDDFWRELSNSWSIGLNRALGELPPFSWEQADQPPSIRSISQS